MKFFVLVSVILGSCVTLAACQSRNESSAAPAPSPEAAPNNNGAAESGSAPSTTSGLPKIVAFGDSLTAGQGLQPSQGYTYMLQQKIDRDGYKYQVVNAGVSGDTSTDGLSRIDWSLDNNVKILILELGANDVLRMQPAEQMQKNLAQIIERAKSKGVEVLLAGMEAPANSDSLYRNQVHQAFADLARKEKVRFIPFVLDHVGGVTSLNQSDGIHPNAEGEKIMTQTVYDGLKPMLRK